MPPSDPIFYLSIVERDQETLRLLSRAALDEGADVSDWQCALVYYMACVYLKALGRARSRDFQDHFALKQWINTEEDLLRIARPYRKLEKRSRDARYEGRQFIQQEQSENLRWFEEVRDAVVDLLREAGIPNVPCVDPSLAME